MAENIGENIGSSGVKGKDKSFVWTDALTRTLLEMLTEYQRQNGKNGFSWIQLTETFEQKTNMKCRKETLKNKYNNMRGSWKLWTSLKHGETGLGWDPQKQCIDATPEWWAQKLQENEEYRVFRKNPFCPEVESMMESLFQGTFATGSHCVAPSMVTKANVTNVTCNTVLPQLPYTDEDDSPYAAHLPVDELIGDGFVVEDATHGVPLDGVDLPFSCPLPSRGQPKKRFSLGTSSSGGTKRNVRKSAGANLYQKTLNSTLRANDTMAEMWEAEKESTAQTSSAALVASNQPKSTCLEALKVIEGMVEEGFLILGSPLWCFALSMTENDYKRMLFTCLSSHDARLPWLEWEFSKEGMKGLIPPKKHD